jgi:hypothetical protein
MNNEFERILQEVVVVKFKITYYPSMILEGLRKTLVRIVAILTEICTWDIPITKQEL